MGWLFNTWILSYRKRSKIPSYRLEKNFWFCLDMIYFIFFAFFFILSKNTTKSQWISKSSGSNQEHTTKKVLTTGWRVSSTSNSIRVEIKNEKNGFHVFWQKKKPLETTLKTIRNHSKKNGNLCKPKFRYLVSAPTNRSIYSNSYSLGNCFGNQLCCG